MTTEQQRTKPDDNRREFIRGSSLLLASALPKSTSSKVVRVGLIGCGRTGQLLASGALQSKTLDAQVQLRGLADLLPNRVQQTARSLKGRCGDAFQVSQGGRFSGAEAARQLLQANDIDAVIVATAVSDRSAIASAAAEAGKHVYVEHPIAILPEGIHQFVSAIAMAQRNGATVEIGSRVNLALRFELAIDAIRAGQIGKVETVRVEVGIDPRKQNADDELHIDWLRAQAEALQLAEAIWSTQLQRCASSSESSSRFYGEGGKRLIVERLPAGENRIKERFNVVGSLGKCELVSGKFWNRTGQMIARNAPATLRRTTDLEQALKNFASNTSTGNALSAIEFGYLPIS